MAVRICGGTLGQSWAMARNSSSTFINEEKRGLSATLVAVAAGDWRDENIATPKIRTINAKGMKKIEAPSQGEPVAAAVGAVDGAVAAELTVVALKVVGPVDVEGAVVMLLQETAITDNTIAKRMAKPETLDMNFPLLWRVWYLRSCRI